MREPPVVTVRTRPVYKLYVWAVTLLLAATTVAVTLRALAWLRFVREEPTLLAMILPVLLFVALTLWMGRWALFHATARVRVDEAGVTMRSLVANDAIRWEAVEAIRLQGTSGSEVQLAGNGHRATLPSGSAAAPEYTLAVQAWLNHQFRDRDLEYGSVHFWGP